MDRESSRRFYPWLPFVTLLRKEILRFWRVASQTLLTPIITASLYLFVIIRKDIVSKTKDRDLILKIQFCN